MKTYPKIIFKYSWIYDQNWKEWIKVYDKKRYKWLSFKKIQNYIKSVEKLWRKDERKVLSELSKVTELKWKLRYIYCYIIGNGISFSDPLTVRYFKEKNQFIDVLIHELIHNLFIQNFEETKKAKQYFDKKYKKESRKTKNHILIHAIHSHIYLKFYNEKRLKRDIDWSSHHPDYKKSWQIVQKEGYQNIINEFVKRVK